MKKTLLALGMATSLVFIAGCGDDSKSNGDSGDGEKNVVKIGSLHPLSGGLALEGQEMLNGVKLAVEEANEAGGIKSMDGAKIELVDSDHEGLAEKGVTEVQKLSTAKVAGIIGAYSSGVALPATQEAERNGVPFVVDIGAADEITERGFKYTFRLQPAATSFSKDFLTYFEDLNKNADTPLKTGVLVYEDSVFGSSISKAIKDNAADYGLEILGDLPHSAASADLSSTINKVNSLKPDVVITTTYLRDGAMLVEGLQSAKFVPKAIIGVANGAFSNAGFISDEKADNQNIMDVNYTINPKSETATKVKEAYKEKYDKNLGPNAAYSYMAAKVLIDAIERAGTDDREKVMEALKETNYEDHILPQEAIQFDEKGQNIGARAVLNQIDGHESKVVYPEEFAEQEVVYPAN